MTEKDRYIYELTNNYERAVFLKGDVVHPRETTRYIWASENILGNKILEIGCSSGYGTQFLSKNIDYTGIDYDERIINVAKQQNWLNNAKFHHADINKFDLDQYDTIIAFEVIEHLDNGLEIVEKLKKHCKRLLITVPHNEPKGFWGEHHKLHGLNESNFPSFEFNYINMNGNISDNIQYVSESNPANLMICKWDKKETVLCSIATRGRYHSTLPMVIQAILNQTKLPDKLMIFDDNDEPQDLRNDFLYAHLFHILNLKKINWEWVYAGKKGQHHIHQVANTTGYDWVWRVDDDAIPEPNVLETLYKYTQLQGVGAIGGAVVTPPLQPQPLNSSGLMDNIQVEPNIQWGYINQLKQVEHLYCSFLYRAGVHDYNLGLSRVAHREETLFSYGLHLKGYKLYVVPDAVTWHLKNPNGGIRSETKQELYEHDEQIFRNVINFKSKKIVVLNCGMGDHVVFSKILPEIENAEVFGCYPEIIPCRPIAEAQALFGDIEQFNIYKKMIEWDWKDSLQNAFRKMYL
jgi:SAM-dependent methyltransferase